MVWIKILEEGNREYYDSEGQREAVWMWRLETGRGGDGKERNREQELIYLLDEEME